VIDILQEASTVFACESRSSFFSLSFFSLAPCRGECLYFPGVRTHPPNFPFCVDLFYCFHVVQRLWFRSPDLAAAFLPIFLLMDLVRGFSSIFDSFHPYRYTIPLRPRVFGGVVCRRFPSFFSLQPRSNASFLRNGSHLISNCPPPPGVGRSRILFVSFFPSRPLPNLISQHSVLN